MQGFPEIFVSSNEKDIKYLLLWDRVFGKIPPILNMFLKLKWILIYLDDEKNIKC
jgi:hypothetical protein